MQPEDKKPVELKDNATSAQNQETPVETPVETPEQINWRKFREARAQERKEKEAAEKRAAEKEAEAQALKAAMEALVNKPTNQRQNEDEELSEDDRIQRKIDERLAIRERQLDEERRQKEIQEFPTKLNQTYSDFHQVCNTENLDYLEFHYPEVAQAYRYMPDGFEKWSAVYKAVKRFVPNTESKKEAAKAEKNFTKPQSMNVSGVTQTGDQAPMALDDARRAANWARMQKVMKGG